VDLELGGGDGIGLARRQAAEVEVEMRREERDINKQKGLIN
jgi:hypothetical protein